MSGLAVARERAPSLEEARRFLTGAFERVRRGRLLAVAVPAPIAPLSAVIGEQADVCCFDPFGAALGVAAAIESRGPRRFHELAAAAARGLFDRVDCEAAEGVALAPRLFGGFAFDDEPEAPEWSGFPAARFVLPRSWYTPGALLFAGDDRERVLHDLEELWPRLLRKGAPGAAAAGPRTIAVENEPGLVGWTGAVEGALEIIRGGTAMKIVLARSTHLRFEAPLDDRRVYEQLSLPESGGLRFLIRAAGKSFVGATPERLLKKQGEVIEADAVAGTSGAAEVEQLWSDKNLREHAHVVSFLRERLGSIAELPGETAPPGIKRSGAIRHLYTPVHARSRAGLFELAALLHPTPAVCGLPQEAAREVIRGSEHFSRGWYAGALGWIDARAEGELYVALRCGLLDGAEAHLYSGAGLVAGSRPADEYLETTMKERVMMRALGAVS